MTRSNHDGSIFKRTVTSKGKEFDYWVAQITLGYSPEGKQIIKQITGKTRKEVLEKLEEIKLQVKQNKYVDKNLISLTQWIHDYLHIYKKIQIRQTTFDKYENLFRNHILTYFQNYRLQDIRTMDIQKFITHKSESLAPATVREIHLVVNQALNQAVIERLIPENPAQNIVLPRIEYNEIEPLTNEEMERLINASKDHRLFHALMLLMGTGIRRGELLGLYWQDVNFEKNTIVIQRNYVKTTIGDIMSEPKTRSSIRAINVPPVVMKILWDYKSTLPPNAIMVVPQLNCDKPISPRNFSRTFSQWCDKADLKTNRVHDLRHTYATQLMALNVPIKVTQAQLRHSNIKTTMGYTHFMDGMQTEASDKLNIKIEALLEKK